MLTRRHIRIKTFLALYAYVFSNNKEVIKGKKELIFSLNKVHELYITFLSAFIELKGFAEEKIENSKQKIRPTEDDLNPNTKFVNNKAILLLEKNLEFKSELNKMKIQWRTEGAYNVIRQIYIELKDSEEYEDYMNSGGDSMEEDQMFLVSIFKNFILNNELLQDVLEDSSIFWNDDLDLVALSVIKTLDNFNEKLDENHSLIYLYKDESDEEFAMDLFVNTVEKDKECSELIRTQIKNWDVERLAKTDVILMNMAIVEALYFPSIPTKVTMNEYIEISKFYSTPKSKGFINGILDKIFKQLKADGKINKMGRGLINKSSTK